MKLKFPDNKGKFLTKNIAYSYEYFNSLDDYLYMNKLEENSNTSDDSDIGYFPEVHLRYPNKKEENTKSLVFCPEKKSFIKRNKMNIRKI